MSALGMMGLVFHVLCFKAQTSHPVSPAPPHPPAPLVTFAVPLSPGPQQGTAHSREKAVGTPWKPKFRSVPTQAPLCPTGDAAHPACLRQDTEAFLNVRKPKVPSVSLQQMLHRDGVKVFKGKEGGSREMTIK